MNLSISSDARSIFCSSRSVSNDHAPFTRARWRASSRLVPPQDLSTREASADAIEAVLPVTAGMVVVDNVEPPAPHHFVQLLGSGYLAFHARVVEQLAPGAHVLHANVRVLVPDALTTRQADGRALA